MNICMQFVLSIWSGLVCINTQSDKVTTFVDICMKMKKKDGVRDFATYGRGNSAVTPYLLFWPYLVLHIYT